MRWHSESLPAWHERIKKWHRWFAWFPVRVGEEMAWLETVERRANFQLYMGWLCWEYRIADEGTAGMTDGDNDG